MHRNADIASLLGSSSIWTRTNFDPRLFGGAECLELLNTALVRTYGLHNCRGLRRADQLDHALLPEGWAVSRNDADGRWDIITPDGPYVDPNECD